MINPITGKEIKEAQFFFTRNCTTRCGACHLPESGACLTELTLEQQKQVFLNMEQLGITDVKILGGEPTETNMETLIKLLKFVSKKTSIRVGLLSNSKWDKNLWLKKLCAAGLHAYYASVDTLKGATYCPNANGKSNGGYGTLMALRQHGGIPLLAANLVISKKNLAEVPELVTKLSKEGFWTNLCPFQCYTKPALLNDGEIEYQFRKGPHKAMLTATDQDALFALQGKLLQMQSHGVRIAAPPMYIRQFAQQGINGGCWECENMYQLRIDADGKAMLCNEFRLLDELPSLGGKIDVQNWTQQLFNLWYDVRPNLTCKCFWSSIYRAKINILLGISEFDFADNPKAYRINLT